jgi:predicted metal-dependent hydrolase
MDTLDFEGISCQVVRRNSRKVRLVFHRGHLRVVLPRHVDPRPIVEKHKKWILDTRDRFERQRLLAGQLDLVQRSNDDFLGLVSDLSKRYSEFLAVRPSAIGFRKMRSKWGSCSAKGKICLNSWLRELPDELIAFIVFHELAHLRVRNHGPAFKALVRSGFPHFRELDRQLKLFSLKIL